MKLKQLAAAAALAAGALVSSQASAVILSGYTTAPGNTVDDFSAAGLVSFDLNLAKLSSTTIDFIVESADLGGPLAFNAIVNNFFGAGISNVRLVLDNASFASIGSVGGGGFGSDPSASGSGGAALIAFGSPEFNFFSIGDPFGLGATDWSIDVSNLGVGDIFSVSFAIPEPGSVPLVLAGIALTGLLRRRRARHLKQQ